MLKIDLSQLNTATLIDMKKEIEKELSNRNIKKSEDFSTSPSFVSYDKNFVTLKTVKNYSIKAAGKPYVAKLSINKDGKIERTFIKTEKMENLNDDIVEAKWFFPVKNGEIIEARLSDGRWGRKKRLYFIVKNKKLKKLDGFEHATNILKKLKSLQEN